MNVLRKILLFVFLVILLAQIPFIYHRYHFASQQKQIAALNSTRTNHTDNNFRDIKGVIHAHTSIGGHSTGQYDELVTAAKNNRLDFVVMTEHPSENFDASAASLKGVHAGVLFINGNELSTASDDRFLLIPGSSKAYAHGWSQTTDFLREEKSQGKLALITYPHRFRSWDADYDGIEVFNLHTNAKKMNPALFALESFWSFGTAPEILIANYFQRPHDELKKFDELTQQRRLTLFAGSDAHSNIGIGLNSDTNDKLFGLKFDPYDSIFKLVRTHVLLPKDASVTQENLLAALKNGNCYIGFDVLGDTSGFSFSADNGAERKSQGDEIALNGNVILTVKTPQKSNILIIRNGETVNAATDIDQVSYPVQEAGVYRVEVYQDSLGSPFNKTPWIISNPIYIR